MPFDPDPPVLEPIVYLLVDGNDPKSFRWRVPESERWRVDNPPSTWPKQDPVGSSYPELPELLAELSRVCYLDERLTNEISDAYLAAPAAVGHAVMGVIDANTKGRLRNPAGALVARLRKISGRAR